MIQPRSLRCEFRSNPLGIDQLHPRLSWHSTADRRAEVQSAYRILVASSPDALSEDRGDLWDSGRVFGNESTLREYAGTPLRSHQRCFWKVMLWDRDLAPGSWSDVAHWTMGMMDPGDWHAEWIGYDAPRNALESFPRTAAQWIWHSGDGPQAPPSERCALASILELDRTKDVREVELAVAAAGSYRLWVNGREVAASAPEPDAWKHPKILRERALLAPGRNVFYVEASARKPLAPGFILWVLVHYTDGSECAMGSAPEWRASAVPVERWKREGPAAGETDAARSFGFFGVAPWRLLDESMLRLPPARYLKGTFHEERPLVRAVLYGSALGVADFFVNGHQVSQERFTPGWSDYKTRLYYRAYDVTPLLHPGTNVLGALLADGWYSGHVGWCAMRDHYGRSPRLLMQLHLEFADGSSTEIGTGGSWSAATGALREADLLMGEHHDARQAHVEMLADARPLPRPVDVGAELSPRMQAHPGPPVTNFAELVALAITEPSPGVWVFDLGRNFAGVVRLRLREERGRRIHLCYGERLDEHGRVYADNLRSARAQDCYICAGTGLETWEPRFTFHGFQYVEVTGLTKKPDAQTVTGVALSSDTPVAGEFSCSLPMLNQLDSNIYWTQRANFIDVPTDCPQRDERLGWTGDAQVYIRSACLHVDAQAFFHKWITDLNDAQRGDGQFPMVAPLLVAGDDGGPAWADAGVICPWTIYQMYGDRSILQASYEHMKRFVEFCHSRSLELLPPADFHCFGDWLNINADTPKEVIATAYFAHASRLLAECAEVLGRISEAEHYARLAADVRSAFRHAYLHEDGTLHGHTQTAYALALSFGLLEGDEAERAGVHLVQDIEQRGGSLSTGFVGTKELLLALSLIGRHDVAYRLLLSTKLPSWGYTIEQGATSIWERWDGWTQDRGFQDPQMNSFAHYAFGAVYEWMVSRIGGIGGEEPGFGRIRIDPAVDPALDWARVVYHSVRGPVTSHWQRSGERVSLSVEIPANTRCTVVLPMVPGTITEAGKPLGEDPEIRIVPAGGARGSVEVGSGRYHFEGKALSPPERR